MARRTDDLVERDWGSESAPARPRREFRPGGAIAGAVANGVFAAVLVAAGSWGLPFMTAGWTVVLPALILERLLAATSGFMAIRPENQVSKNLGKMAEHGAGAWASWMLWQHYPFDFSRMGLPPEIDHWLPWAFAAFAAIHVMGGIGSFFGMFKKNRPSRPKNGNGNDPDGDVIS